MTPETAQTIGLQAVTFVFSHDDLRDRFLGLSGMVVDDIRKRLQEPDFLVAVLDFLITFEPDLIACADHVQEKPETLVAAWRALGGGEGQEW